MNRRQIASYIDHTLLKPEATASDIEKLCAEAGRYGFFGVCVNSSWIRRASLSLQGTDVKVVSVAGFPLGAMSTSVKCREIEEAISDGATEVDVVLNIGRLIQGDHSYVLGELREAVRAAGGNLVKVIMETCLLNNDQKESACRIAVESGAHFVKTSTGFSSGGATPADVRLMRRSVGPHFGVKASGGIRDAAAALEMISEGATRIGTSSGVSICRSLADLNETD